METGFRNVYGDRARADAYASLEFPNTYWLAFRDLPEIVRGCARGRRALDFGCGAGRSTRFLRGLGFEVTGVDIAGEMLERARAADAGGDYRLVPDGDLATLKQHRKESFEALESVSAAKRASEQQAATDANPQPHHNQPDDDQRAAQ